MRIFFTGEQIAESKALWEPRLRTFAASTNATLRNLRRLPIYEHAVRLASQWLEDAIPQRAHLPASEVLVIVGDEHVDAAASKVTLPSDTIFLYRQAWTHWFSNVYRGEAPWWQAISWAINCPERIIALAYPFDRNLRLTPNLTYLCSEESGNQGLDSILQLVDDKLVTTEILSEWVDSV